MRTRISFLLGILAVVLLTGAATSGIFSWSVTSPSTGQVLTYNSTTTRWENAAASGGTVTSVSVVTANGVSGSVATSTTTPAITLTLGAITPSSVSTSGDFQTTVIGKTLNIKSGANAKAGTFTLSSGTVTVSNTGITANSVVACTVKTSSGTLGTGTPEIVVTAGVGFTATGVVTDNSTYNFVVLEVN